MIHDFSQANILPFSSVTGVVGLVGWFWLGGLALAWCLLVRDSVWSKPLLAGCYSDPQVGYYQAQTGSGFSISGRVG